MPKYLISITEAAEQDLTEIIEYIANDSPIAALKLTDEFEQSILQLEAFPLSGVSPKNRRLARQGYRMLIVENYLIFYVRKLQVQVEHFGRTIVKIQAA